MENVNNSFFDGHYKEIWKTIVPPELAIKETDFMFRHFDLQPGNKVLDLMCGAGRHSIALSERGVAVTAVDNLSDYIDEIRSIAAGKNLPIKVTQADILKYEADEVYDLAICMGNSLCFFDREDTVKILKMISKSLKTGGHFFLNTWTLAEIAFNDFRERSWSNFGDVKLIAESKFLLHPTRIETNSLMLTNDGNQEVKKAVDYIYSIAETELMLNEAGLFFKEIYSIPGKKKFTLGDPRAYIIAEKT